MNERTAGRSLLREPVDVLVVGAGTAGATVAGCAAAHGLRVLCVERGELARAGAQWVNGVSREAFTAAGVPLPTGDELRGSDGRFHMVALRGPHSVVIEDHGVLDVDMRRLVARLQQRARESGTRFVPNVRVHGIEGSQVITSDDPVRAQIVVDASGLGGARLLGTPTSHRRDLCAAAQAVHALADPAGARAFLDAHGAAEGETLCFTGIAGGYSILNVCVHDDEVSVLTGSIPADGHRSGREILERFVTESPWIGARIFGGQRAIPLGRPLDTLVTGRVAAVGDAARQVFSAHGSGIGAGMIAGRMLADTLHQTGRAEDYERRWMRRHGGLFAAYDTFRRFSQTLTGAELERLIASGVLDADSGAAGLAQQWPRPSLRRALRLPSQLARAGILGRRLAEVGARMATLRALYAAYPSIDSRARWSAMVAAVSGEPRA